MIISQFLYIVSLQETHGCNADLEEPRARRQDCQLFGTFCDNGSEGCLIVVARKSLLTHFDNNATVTNKDQGKIGTNYAFMKVLKDNDYSLATTGADSSAQNGLAEKTNKDLA